MIRYQIRNEYGLADPELYAPGEKDDPEALLEGVAMAGLVGVLRQLGDLAEFAAEMFHDLHEDVMATASRGHGLMLRLQQLEAEFPAVEKAIVSQTSHSSFPHDDGVEWHANLQMDQNLITRGDMPRFIMDSYEECRGPPRLFTLDKFDIAGAGACLKRYSDPSFFKLEFASSSMIETDVLIEKKPRKSKKKALHCRKGETLESLLVTNSDSHTVSKECASSKVPPRTTKLKSRHSRDPDHKSISQTCREHLMDVISSQQKILSQYSVKQYPVKVKLNGPSELASLGEFDKDAPFAHVPANMELTKVVPINESDSCESKVVPFNESDSQETDERRYSHAEVEEIPEKLKEGRNRWGAESNSVSQLLLQERILSGDAAPVTNRSADDMGSDQDNFVDALNTMESEVETDSEAKARRDSSFTKKEQNSVDSDSKENKEGKKGLHVQLSEIGSGIGSSLPGLNSSCENGEPAYLDSDPSTDFAAAQSTKKANLDSSPTYREIPSDVDWINAEPFHDDDLMDVSSSSSVPLNEICNLDMADNPNINGQALEGSYAFCGNNLISGLEASHQSGMVFSCETQLGTDQASNCLDEHAEDLILDAAAEIPDKPNDVSQVEETVREVGSANDLLLLETMPGQEELREYKEQDEDVSSGVSTSPIKLGFLTDISSVAQPDNVVVGMDKVAFAESISGSVTSTCVVDPNGIAKHQDELDSGDAPIPSEMLNHMPEMHDGAIIEDLHSPQNGGLSIPVDMLVAEDQKTAEKQVVFSTGSHSSKENVMDPSSMREYCSKAEEPSEPTEIISFPLNVHVFEQQLSPQDDMEACSSKVHLPTNCVQKDWTEILLSEVLLPSSAASLPVISSSCVEPNDFTLKSEKFVKPGDGLVDTEMIKVLDTSSVSLPCLIPSGIQHIGGAKDTESSKHVSTSCQDETSPCDMQLQANAPRTEEIDSMLTIRDNLRLEDELIEHNFEKGASSIEGQLQSGDLVTANHIDTDDSALYELSSVHFPEVASHQVELQKDPTVTAQVLGQADLEIDDLVSLKKDVVEELFTLPISLPSKVEQQPSDMGTASIGQLADGDSCSTNPYMDLNYLVSHSQTDLCPSISNLAYFFEQEQDFSSGDLLKDDNMGANGNISPDVDSFWEPATPPDEAALISEVRPEVDSGSFYHEYHEVGSAAITEDLDHQPSKEGSSSKSHDSSNGGNVSQLDFLRSSSVVPLEQEQEACFSPELDSQLVPCPLTSNVPAKASISLATNEDLDHQPLDVDSDKNSHGFSSDTEIVESNGGPSSNAVLVELEKKSHVSPESNSRTVSFSSNDDKIAELDGSPSRHAVSVQLEQETHVSPELCSQTVPCSSNDGKIAELDVPPSSNAVPVEREQQARVSPELDSRTVPCSSNDGEIAEPDAPPSSNNAVPVKIEQQARVSPELDSQTVPCSSNDGEIAELDAPPSSHNAVQVELEQQACVSPELDSQAVRCSSNDGEIAELDAPPSGSAPVELDLTVRLSPEFDSQSLPCSSDNSKIAELDVPPSNNAVSVELEQEARVSPEVDSPILPCSLTSNLLDEVSTTFSSSVPTMSEENCQLCPVQLPDGPSSNISFQDLEKLPPLPPLQWRLGKTWSGFSRPNGHLLEPMAATNPFLESSSTDKDNRSSLLTEVAQSTNPFTSPEIQDDRFRNGWLENKVQKEEALRLSDKDDRPSLLTGVVQLTSPFSVPKAEKDRFQNNLLDKDGKTAEPLRLSAVPPIVDAEITEHDRLSSDTADHIEHRECTSLDASEDGKQVEGRGFAGGAPLHPTNPFAPGPVLEDGNSQQSPTLQERNVQTSGTENSQGSLFPSAELKRSQDCPHDDLSLERETIEPSNPFLVGSVIEADKSNNVSGLCDGNSVELHQPSVIRWTAGPQMLHPSYMSMEEKPFEATIEDHRLIRKPISLRNIPRNPLIDAVAAHDRSTMRKVSELVHSSDKPKANERNLLLEQIRNKSFNLKPVVSNKPTMKAPARNLKVAAIVEKANAIRQAFVGSDEEDDGDNWSDA